MEQQLSFMAACKKFFGLKPGQTALEFGKELKELSSKDREEITAMLTEIGYSIKLATASA